MSLPKHPSCARLPALTDQKDVKDGRALLEGEAGAAMPDAAAAAAAPRDGTAPDGVPECLCSPVASLWGTLQAAPSPGVLPAPASPHAPPVLLTPASLVCFWWPRLSGAHRTFCATRGVREQAAWCCHAGQEAQLAWQRMALPVISALHFQKAAARRTQSSAAETPQASPSEPERGPGAAHAPALASMYCWGHPLGATVFPQDCAYMCPCPHSPASPMFTFVLALLTSPCTCSWTCALP